MAPELSVNEVLSTVSSAESSLREVGGVTLHVVAAGDPADPLVVLLHGFPEFWYEWREYVGPLVEAGYRVVVPDQRGYNRSDKPGGVRPYRIDALSGDVVDLVATEGRESAHVVGHDWGAGVAWDTALRHPEVVDRLAVVNGPHPTAAQAVTTRSLAQLRKSWYMAYFQLPRLPEWTARRNDFGWLVSALRDEARRGAFSDADIERYRRAWQREGALTAMFNWYRALRYGVDPPREQVRVPTLLVWGADDRAFVPEMPTRSVEYCEDGRLERVPDATHWVVHEEHERVTGLLLDHLDG
jgi:pimeloyl-ACP methyl ester carboxylesterase